MRETQLAKAVAQFLAFALPPSFVFTHVPGEGKRGKQARRELNDSGYRKGFPDLIIFGDGKAWWIELKAPKKYPDQDQRQCHRDLRNADCPGIVARSLADVELFLRGEGVDLRAHESYTPARRAA